MKKKIYFIVPCVHLRVNYLRDLNIVGVNRRKSVSRVNWGQKRTWLAWATGT